MRKYLAWLGGAVLLHLSTTSGCAKGTPDDEIPLEVKDASVEVGSDALQDVSVDNPVDAAKGGAAGTSGASGSGGAGGGASGGGGTAGTAGGAGGGGGTAGTAGAAGEGGTAGQGGGTGGTGGTAGTSGSGGTAGAGGTATGGTAGTSGKGGTAGQGGTAGSGGTGGTAGTGGIAGSGGTGGTGGTAGTAGLGGTGGTVATAYSHTIFIDGQNDFNADDTFLTSSSGTGYTGYVSWDLTYFYLGMKGADVAADSTTKWVLVYFDGSPTVPKSQLYNTQQANLPFGAHWHFRWQTSNDFASMKVASGNNWIEAVPAWNLTGDIMQSGDFVEMRFPLSELGMPVSIKVFFCMLNEEANHEATYAAVPWNSITDGYNPTTYTKYFKFDLTTPKKPKDYTPLP